jgi:hypothetical protein
VFRHEQAGATGATGLKLGHQTRLRQRKRRLIFRLFAQSDEEAQVSAEVQEGQFEPRLLLVLVFLPASPPLGCRPNKKPKGLSL